MATKKNEKPEVDNSLDELINEIDNELAAAGSAVDDGEVSVVGDDATAEVVSASHTDPGRSTGMVRSEQPAETTAPATAQVATRRIILEENDDIPPTGLYVGHNGRGYLIQVGREVDIPVHVLEILDNARVSRPIVDPENSQIIGYRERMRYPYRMVAN